MLRPAVRREVVFLILRGRVCSTFQKELDHLRLRFPCRPVESRCTVDVRFYINSVRQEILDYLDTVADGGASKHIQLSVWLFLPGRLHAKSLSEQDFREVCVIPACVESLVLDTNFG